MKFNTRAIHGGQILDPAYGSVMTPIYMEMTSTERTALIKDLESINIDKDLKNQDIAVKDGKIVEIGKISDEAKEIFDAKNLTVLPGCIDTQTHFR